MNEEELKDQKFQKEIESVLNRYSRENASNTPDFILAQYLTSCLAAWNTGVQQRETWYGRDGRPSLRTPVQPAQPIEAKPLCEYCGDSGTYFPDPMTDEPANCRYCPPAQPEGGEGKQMKIMKRCDAAFRCQNPPLVVVDFKSKTMGWKTKRICVPCARTLLADTIGTDQEAREHEAKIAAMSKPPTVEAGKEKL